MIKQQQKLPFTDSVIVEQHHTETIKQTIMRDSIEQSVELFQSMESKKRTSQKQEKSGLSILQVQRNLSPVNTFYKNSDVTRENTNVISVGCQKCEAWKMWAIEHQRQMLELQKQLILKQSQLVSVIKGQKEKLNDKQLRIKDLQNKIKQEEERIICLQNEIIKIKKEYQEMENKKCFNTTAKKTLKNVQIQTSPPKIIVMDKLQPIPLENTEKSKNIVKTSTLTTKTEGWQQVQTLKKPTMLAETASIETRRSDYEKCLFDNQTLRDYNATLLQRLNSARLKKAIF